MPRKRINRLSKDGQKTDGQAGIDGGGDGNPFAVGKDRGGPESGTGGNKGEAKRGIDPAAAAAYFKRTAAAVAAETPGADAPESGVAPEAPREKRHYTPRGSKQNIKDAVGTLTAILVTVHHGLAVLTENPELELAEDESEALIETWAELQQYYKPIAVSPKTMAWYHFGVTFFAVYAKKVKDIRARKKAAQPQPAPRQTGTVVDLRPAGLARVEPVARPEPPATPAPAQPPPGVAVRALTPHELSGEGGALTDGAA